MLTLSLISREKETETSIISVFMDFSLDVNSKNISMIQKITPICKDEFSCHNSFLLSRYRTTIFQV